MNSSANHFPNLDRKRGIGPGIPYGTRLVSLVKAAGEKKIVPWLYPHRIWSQNFDLSMAEHAKSITVVDDQRQQKIK